MTRPYPSSLSDGISADELTRRLWDDYSIEMPIVEWEGWRFVCVSIQAYNTLRDVYVCRLTRALDEFQ
jgi:hypothetical protein